MNEHHQWFQQVIQRNAVIFLQMIRRLLTNMFLDSTMTIQKLSVNKQMEILFLSMPKKNDWMTIDKLLVTRMQYQDDLTSHFSLSFFEFIIFFLFCLSS